MDDEHIIQECICLKCFYRWIDVRPVGTRLKDLECPGCHQLWYVIGTGEPLEEQEQDGLKHYFDGSIEP